MFLSGEVARWDKGKNRPTIACCRDNIDLDSTFTPSSSKLHGYCRWEICQIHSPNSPASTGLPSYPSTHYCGQESLELSVLYLPLRVPFGSEFNGVQHARHCPQNCTIRLIIERHRHPTPVAYNNIIVTSTTTCPQKRSIMIAQLITTGGIRAIQ